MINTTQRSYAAGYCDPSTPPHSPKTTAYQACPKPRPNLRLHHAFGTLVSGSSLGLLGCVLAAATLFAQPQGKPSAAGANPPPKSEGTDEDNSLAAARTALKRGDYDEAIKRASEALRAHPEDEAAKRLLEQAQQAKRDDKRDHDRALELAREAMRSGDYGKAIEFLTLVVNGWPADADAKELLSQARKASTVKPSYDAALAAAQRALNTGDYDSAIAQANEALRIRPGDRTATDVLVRANVRKGMVVGEKAPPAAVTEVTPAAPTPKEKTVAPVQGAEATPLAPSIAEISGTNQVPSTLPSGTKHEISFSGDFFMGQGNVTMPFGFSLARVPGLERTIIPNVAQPDRSSDYIGATLSYSYGQAWYIDLGYVQGSSSGSVDVQLGPNDAPKLPSSFKIEDEMYQAYIRYTFPRLRRKPFSAYLRAGFSFVNAKLTDATVIPALGLYHQTDDTTDLLGNLGFGVGYSLYTSRRARLGVQAEVEGFYGFRTQDSKEILPEHGLGSFPAAKIDNDLYGGIGRGTVRYEYRLGKSGLFKVFAEGGLQGKFTLINYSSSGNFKGGSFNELLWGPYAKLGLRYAF